MCSCCIHSLNWIYINIRARIQCKKRVFSLFLERVWNGSKHALNLNLFFRTDRQRERKISMLLLMMSCLQEMSNKCQVLNKSWPTILYLSKIFLEILRILRDNMLRKTNFFLFLIPKKIYYFLPRL